MKHFILQMRKSSSNEQITIELKLTKTYLSNEPKNSSDEQKNDFQMNQRDSSNEQIFFGDLLNYVSFVHLNYKLGPF